MFGKTKPEVLIAGAGPVGLFTALCLVRRGIGVQIVDEEWRQAAHSYALALHPGSLRLLDEVGLLSSVLDEAYRVRTVGLYDHGGRRAEMRLADLAGDFSFVAVLQQERLEGLLANALRDVGVKVSWNHRVARFEQDGDRVRVDVDKLVKDSVGYGVAHTEWSVQRTRELEVAFLIGADGHRSLVRRALDIPFDALGETQHFAVFEFATDADLRNELCVVFNVQDTNVMWPLPDGFCRWSFQLLDSEIPEDTRRKGRLAVEIGSDRYPVVDLDRLAPWLQQRAPWFKGSVEEVRWRMAVRFERRLARQFGQGRVWLVGDAGHMNYPVGAQSMNVGLLEARELAETLAGLLSGGAPVDQLEQYGRGRLNEWGFLFGKQGRFGPGDQADPWVWRNAERVLPCIPAAREELSLLAAQVGLQAEVPATTP